MKRLALVAVLALCAQAQAVELPDWAAVLFWPQTAPWSAPNVTAGGTGPCGQLGAPTTGPCGCGCANDYRHKTAPFVPSTACLSGLNDFVRKPSPCVPAERCPAGPVDYLRKPLTALRSNCVGGYQCVPEVPGQASLPCAPGQASR